MALKLASFLFFLAFVSIQVHATETNFFSQTLPTTTRKLLGNTPHTTTTTTPVTTTATDNNDQNQETYTTYPNTNTNTNGVTIRDGKYYYDVNNNRGKYWYKRQGMSDTKFLENGKYYYDVNIENANNNNNANYDKLHGKAQP